MEVLFECMVYGTAGWFIGKAFQGDAYQTMDYLVAALGAGVLVAEIILMLLT